MENSKRKVRIFFLGTNGWFATKTGNTVCAAIRAKDKLIVLDAGDGFQHAPALMGRLGIRRADVFLSHLHIDHIAGLHLLPLLPRGMCVRIFAHRSYLPALKKFVAHPYTASPPEQYARVSLHPLSTGENNVPYPVHALPLRHADPCFGFRFQVGGRRIAYCTDTGPCKNIQALAQGADALITECSLLPRAGEHAGWPHLSPEMAAREAEKAGAQMLLLTHFDAKEYRAFSQRAAAQKAARKIFPRAFASRDGMEIGI